MNFNEQNLAITLAIAGLLAILPVTGVYAQAEDEPLSGTIKIGGLFPLSGGLSSFGINMEAGAALAVKDFNAYLTEQGADWQLEWVIEDTNTNPVVSLEKIQVMNAKGITAIVGPAGSASLSNIKSYADANNIILISPSSTAPSLSIAGDNIFRLVPDDENQGVALSKLLVANGIDAIVPVWRGEAYGDGLRNAVKANFEDRGGFVHPGVRYAPDSPEFSAEISVLNKYVRSTINEYGADKTAVLIIAFEEGVTIAQSARLYDKLSSIRWFSSEGMAESPDLVKDRLAADFAQTVGFTAVQFLLSPGEKAERLATEIQNKLGEDPISFTYPSYDAVWVLGMSIMKANSADPTDIKAVLPDVAKSYTGAMRSTALNEAGDLVLANYQVWEIMNNQWTKTQKYAAEKDLLVAVDQPSGDVQIGSLYPLTGRLSSKGAENQAGTQLGVDDFNAFLNSIEAGWQLSLTVEDSETNPNIAFQKAQALFAKGIDIIIGPETSGNTRQIKPYADTNDMMLISCCSTAPNLAIPNDSIFRLVPDDSKQGVAVSKLFQAEGIDAIVPIWRNDAYGDGLQNSTRINFESRGGVVDAGIGYNPDASDFSGEVSVLADRVQALVDEYGTDRVAVFMISFDESVQIVQASKNYPILDDIRWFGSESLTKATPIITDPIGNEFANTVRFTSMQIVENRGDAYQRVQSHIYDTYGRDPTTFVYQAYDASWLVGLSMLKSGATDAGTIKATLPGVAATYDGALGGTVLNEAGDLQTADYAIWGIVGDEWVEMGKYSLQNDTVEKFDATN